MNEEQKMIQQEEMLVDDDGYVYYYPKIPYFLLDDEVGEEKRTDYFHDFAKILRYYSAYKKGCNFIAEGSNGDYVPSDVRFKKAAMIVKKEARFLFSNTPSFNVNVDNVEGKNTKENAIIQDYLDKVLKKAQFENKLLKGLKDCFIGGRVAIVLNVRNDKMNIVFLNALEFIFEYDAEEEELTKLITFNQLNTTDELSKQIWFKKVYTKEADGVYIEETVWDGSHEKLRVETPKTKIKFDVIPAVVVFNDGLTGDFKGVSEIGDLLDYESVYSKLSNADIDAERKSMNPIKWTADASNGSTENLPISPGSYWDLQSNDDQAEARQVKVGTLEAQMNYSGPLKTTMDRIENEMFAELDVPNITSEQLAGVITSGKTIQALYWGLTVRCDEKMLAWAPALRFIAELIIEAGILYPNAIGRYTDAKSIPVIPYDILVENNYPIPEDIKEEKELDISEVEAKLMSRKAYLKKWRNLNDSEADSEIEQIMIESEKLDNTYLNYTTDDTIPVDMDKNETAETNNPGNANNNSDGNEEQIDE